MFRVLSCMKLSYIALATFFGFSTAEQFPLAAEDEVTSSLSYPPLLGFGTWNLDISPENTTAAVSAAIQAGYRHIDCAAAYGNEVEVGKGVREGLEKAGLERKDIWVTSKLFNNNHEPARVPIAFQNSLEKFDIGYLDLYLMHWPVASVDGEWIIDYLDTWAAMTALPKTHVRHIGVSNFSPHQLTDLIHSFPNDKPFAHQFETHPYLQQQRWVTFHNYYDIHVTAYSPLANLNPVYNQDSYTILTDPDIIEIAKRRDCTNAQVALSWGIGRGTSVIPKSSHVKWIKENYNSLDCKLEDEDVAQIERIKERFVKRFNDPGQGWGVNLFEGLEGNEGNEEAHELSSTDW